jgi:hypothetical protein
MERMWVTRLRWRMRGAWLWPCFVALTVIDGLLLHRLPPYGDGPGTFIAALLVAGFGNLFVIAVIAPLAGRRLRRRRRDLPKLIADNYAGTALIAAAAIALAVAGLVHRPALAAQRVDAAAAAARTHDYVLAEAPVEYRERLGLMNVMRLKEDYYRSCVPGGDERKWFCLFVDTAQRPAGATRDPDLVPNAAYQLQGGFR